MGWHSNIDAGNDSWSQRTELATLGDWKWETSSVSLVVYLRQDRVSQWVETGKSERDLHRGNWWHQRNEEVESKKVKWELSRTDRSEILSCLQANELTYQSLIAAGKRHETPGLETKNSLLLTTGAGVGPSAFVQLFPPSVPTGSCVKD